MPQNVEIMRAGIGALNDRDAEAFAMLFARDAEIVPIRAALEGTVYRAPDGVMEFFADLEESWEELTIEAEEIRDGGEWVLAIGRLRGRGRGSGAEFDTRMGWVLRIRDGKATSLRTYPDPAAALEAVGLRE